MKTRARLFFRHGADIIAEDGPVRRSRWNPTLMAVALAASVCLALALVAPRPQPALAAAIHTREAPTAAQLRALIAKEHLKPTTLMAPRIDRTRYTICLRNAESHCGSYFDIAGTVVAVATAVLAAKAIYDVFSNKSGDSTDQSKGEEGGGGESGKDDCLADAPTTSDGNDRGYYTSNCFSNKYASWFCVKEDHDTACHYYSVAAIDENRAYMLTCLNLRNGAYQYAKPATAGTWQLWSWFKYSGSSKGKHPAPKTALRVATVRG